jgi:NADP-dependent 3-hydroxy acid dehydrogenase YdfG
MGGGNAAECRRLNDKIVFVAGASTSMGRATAVECAREGASVVLATRRREPLGEVATEIAAWGRWARICPADLADAAAAEGALARATEQLGPIDVVVITAGTNIRERALGVLSQEG